jgi:hypothetical protein
MKEITLQKVTKTAWILIAIAFFIALVTQNLSIILGVIIGSFLGLLNFKALILATQRGIKAKRTKLYLFISYLLRLTILGLILIIIFSTKIINFIAVIVGLSMVILAICIQGIINLRGGLSDAQKAK